MTVATAPLFHISFYRFVRLGDAAHTAVLVRELATTCQLEGLIDVAPEGISGAVSGTGGQLDAFEKELTTHAAFAAAFTGTVFKRTTCQSKPFYMLKVSCAAELIRIGLDDQTNRSVDATTAHGVPCSPQEWRELLAANDVVVIDNRNSFEFELGHFKGAINPSVAHYRDFPKFIETNLPIWKEQNKRIAMYCTGGIRCDKTAAWLDNLNTTVYTLEGGIISYLAAMPDAEKDWTGECFVFDNRVSLDVNLAETDTDIEDVYNEARDGAWRIERAKRLAGR